MTKSVSLPSSCENLPSSVINDLSNLYRRVSALEWLSGPRDEIICAKLMQEYFRRLELVNRRVRQKQAWSSSSDTTRALFWKSDDKDYQDFGDFGICWIRGDWQRANEWTSHCYFRGNSSALLSTIDYIESVAQENGRDPARHDCWELFGKMAKNNAFERVNDGAWFTAGTTAAWMTISDLVEHKNPFEPMLEVWEQGFWPIGHLHHYQNDFVIFKPDVSPIPVFISYKWQDEDRNAWVEKLYLDLRYEGIDAKLDRYDVPLGGSFTQYMTSKIDECKRVLFIVTPASVEATNNGLGGIGFEAQFANSIRMSGERGAFIIPILREGSVPPNLLRDYRWIDFRDDRAYHARLSELVNWLSNEITPPPLGQSRHRI